MADDELEKLLRGIDDKLGKSAEKQNELDRRLSELEKTLHPDDKEEMVAEPEHDEVKDFVLSLKKEKEDKARRRDERLRIKSDAELDADAAKLLERMLKEESDTGD